MSITADTTAPTVPLPAESDPAPLFQYQTWVHAGAGAEGCAEVDENEGKNGCGDRGHFHAWCRLPNPLQHAEIRDRALAAKARKIRQLRDPDTDAYAILEEEFQALARQGDQAREQLIEELIQLDYFQDYYQAMLEARHLEDPDAQDEDAPRLYQHVEDDQARFRRLELTPEADRPKDEYEELQKHLAAYGEAVDHALRERQDPKRQALEGLGTEQLLDQLRDRRVETEALREFQRVFEVNEWLSCAYREPDGAQILADMTVLERAAPEIVAALQAAFNDLKRTAQEAQGN